MVLRMAYSKEKLHVFAYTGQRVWLKSQKAPNSNWESWQALPGNFTGSHNLAVATNLDQRLEAFVSAYDPNGHFIVYGNSQNQDGYWRDEWSPFGWGVGGYFFDELTVAPNSDGRLDLFKTGPTLYHRWQLNPNGIHGWSIDYSLGHPQNIPIHQRIAVGKNQDGRLEGFIVGADGALWHIWQRALNNVWSGWASRATPPNVALYSAPTVGSNKDGRLEVFAAGNDGQIWHIGQTRPNNGWGNWASLGQPPGTSIMSAAFGHNMVVLSNQDGRLELLIPGNEGTLWDIYQTAANGNWSNWTQMGHPTGATVGLLAGGSNKDGRLEIVTWGSDRNLWHKWQTAINNGWSEWTNFGKPS